MMPEYRATYVHVYLYIRERGIDIDIGMDTDMDIAIDKRETSLYVCAHILTCVHTHTYTVLMYTRR